MVYPCKRFASANHLPTRSHQTWDLFALVKADGPPAGTWSTALLAKVFEDLGLTTYLTHEFWLPLVRVLEKHVIGRVVADLEIDFFLVSVGLHVQVFVQVTIAIAVIAGFAVIRAQRRAELVDF